MGSPTLETGAPLDGGSSSGEDSDMLAATAVGIASVVVAFLGAVELPCVPAGETSPLHRHRGTTWLQP